MKPKDGVYCLMKSIASTMNWPLISGSSLLLHLSWMDLEILSVAIEFQQCDFFNLYRTVTHKLEMSFPLR